MDYHDVYMYMYGTIFYDQDVHIDLLTECSVCVTSYPVLAMIMRTNQRLRIVDDESIHSKSHQIPGSRKTSYT